MDTAPKKRGGGKPPGWIVLAIQAALQEHHELTKAELRRLTGLEHKEISSVVSRMSKPTTMHPKRVYVVRYVYDAEGSTVHYPRAVFALGDKPCAKKPKPDRAVVALRYRRNKQMRVTSVFDLGRKTRERGVTLPARKAA